MAEFLTYRGATYPWQADQIGHMNVMWYVGKFDEATWNLFTRIGVTPSYIRDQRRGMAAVQQNIAYKREVLPGDTLEVHSSVLEIRDRVIRFRHRMQNAETGATVADCELTAVHMDRDVRKSCPFPPDVRAQAETLLAATPAATLAAAPA